MIGEILSFADWKLNMRYLFCIVFFSEKEKEHKTPLLRLYLLKIMGI